MKARLFIISVLFRLCVAAQTYVTIPDSQFVHWLTSHVPAAMNGNQMDITHPSVTTMTFMPISGTQIVNLSGVEYFSSLITLDDHMGSQLTTIPALPSSLKHIRINMCPHLSNFPPLPNGLIQLECVHDSLTSLPVLPSSLQLLDCQTNFLSALPSLPASLITLQCSNNLIKTLPALPSSLVNLSCYSDSLTTLPSLPNSLSSLACYNNELVTLPSLPDSLLILVCEYNDITCFPPFPDSIRVLDISQNPFTCLPNYIKAMDSITRSYPLCEIGNQYGCDHVVPTSVTIPNVFTPNGDNINDLFFIQATDIADLSCSIYNRWGSLVYQFSNSTKSWDGKLKNGAACSDGTYYYVVSYTDYKKNTVSKSGFLELLR